MRISVGAFIPAAPFQAIASRASRRSPAGSGPTHRQTLSLGDVCVNRTSMLPRSAVPLHDPLEKLQRRSLVPLRSDDRFQNLAFMIDGAPEIAEFAVDLHEHLIQMPTPL